MKAPARHDFGQEMVEFALVIPILVVLLLGIMELGAIVMRYNTIANAAREGARFAVVVPNQEYIEDASELCFPAPSNEIIQFVCERMPSLDPSAATVTVSPEGSGVGFQRLVSVQVDYDSDLVTAPVVQALGLGNTISLQATSVMRLE